jgi:nicotinate-nucleotide pyrophosphorylase (carboxylating)
MSLLPTLLDAIIERALVEDLAGGDLTSEACIHADAVATGAAHARSPIVACGGQVFRRVFELIDPTVVVEAVAPDGARVDAGAPLWRLRGRARALLAGERTALNLVQRMCGVATMARRYVDAVPKGLATRITDTRKTTPGLRALERYAVRTGGAHNHRDSLGSAVLIKDNHIVAAGGITPAIQRARDLAPHTSRVEVEVDSLSQLDEALDAGADVILIDNFATPDVREAVARVRARAPYRPLVEASGGITLARIPELAEAGVDLISVGALTHSAPAADIGLDFAL